MTGVVCGFKVRRSSGTSSLSESEDDLRANIRRDKEREHNIRKDAEGVTAKNELSIKHTRQSGG